MNNNTEGKFKFIFIMGILLMVGIYNHNNFMIWGILICGGLIFLNNLRVKRKVTARTQYIMSYKFPSTVQQRFLQHHPMTPEQLRQVELGLKQFFLIVINRRGKVAMPSKIVDEYWHTFLLSSRHYQLFCQAAFGHTLHHIPDADEPLQPTLIKRFSPPMRNAYAGAKQVSAEMPLMMVAGFPLLFMLDSELRISDGFYYDIAAFGRLEQQIQQSVEQGGTDSGSCGGTIADGCGQEGGGADGCGCSSSCSSSSSCGGGCGGGGD